LIEGVLASFAQFDNDVRSDRTRAGMRAALELGRWTFPAPIGYLNAPKWSGKSLVPDPERAPLIARAFEELATGRFTKQEVIARMTEAGLRTRRGLVFSPQSFGQMVRNSIYVGRVESPDYGVSPRGDFEPLIDEATFYRAQAVLIAASSWPVRDSAITRTSRCAASCAARRAAGRSPAAGRRAGTATTRITTVSVNAAR
jgi:site-specific DNA recombinase